MNKLKTITQFLRNIVLNAHLKYNCINWIYYIMIYSYTMKYKRFQPIINTYVPHGKRNSLNIFSF